MGPEPRGSVGTLMFRPNIYVSNKSITNTKIYQLIPCSLWIFIHTLYLTRRTQTVPNGGLTHPRTNPRVQTTVGARHTEVGERTPVTCLSTGNGHHEGSGTTHGPFLHPPDVEGNTPSKVFLHGPLVRTQTGPKRTEKWVCEGKKQQKQNYFKKTCIKV